MNTALQTTTELAALNFKLANKKISKIHVYRPTWVRRLSQMKESLGGCILLVFICTRRQEENRVSLFQSV